MQAIEKFKMALAIDSTRHDILWCLGNAYTSQVKCSTYEVCQLVGEELHLFNGMVITYAHEAQQLHMHSKFGAPCTTYFPLTLPCISQCYSADTYICIGLEDIRSVC